MTDAKVRFAVIGCGRISQSHFNAIRQAPDAELAAVCDIVAAKAANAAQDNHLRRWYTNISAMLENENIDVVDICLPSGIHCENAVIAAKAGKHVLCEKPLDITREKMSLMIETCRKQGVLLGGIFQRRTCSAAIDTKKALAANKIGRLVMGSAYLKYYRDQKYYEADSWRGTWNLDGGGALMNQGVHGIDLLQWMAGDISSVCAFCGTLARNIEVEDTAVAAIKFKNGAMGVIEGATSVYPGQDTILSLNGDKGTISFADDQFLQWEFMDSRETPPEIKYGLGGKNCGWTDGNEGHTVLIQDMAEAVLNGREPMIPGVEARKAVDVILAIYESARTHREIYL